MYDNGDEHGACISLHFIDFFVLNIPLWLFTLLAAAGLVLWISSPFSLKLIPPILVVWGTSGAVLMAYDYHTRKRALFLRLSSREPPPKGSALYRSLCATPCGLSLLLAAELARKRMAHSGASASL